MMVTIINSKATSIHIFDQLVKANQVHEGD